MAKDWMAKDWYGSRAGTAPLRQRSCPVCEMVLTHQPGCPYGGLTMTEAWTVHQQRTDEAREEASMAYHQEQQSMAEARKEAFMANFREQHRKKHEKRRKRRPDEGEASRATSAPPADAGADQAGQHLQEADSKDS